LFALRAAGRKHGVPVDELAAVLATYKADLDMLESGEEALSAAEKAAASQAKAYHAAARKLSGLRAACAAELESAVLAELPDLKLGAARFIVDRQVDESRVSASGYD